MKRRRIVVAGLTLVVLAAGAAGALRMIQLERRVALLEAAQHSQVTQNAAINPPLTVQWSPADSMTSVLPAPAFPDGTRLPNGAEPHEINGLTYYVMPLGSSANPGTQR